MHYYIVIFLALIRFSNGAKEKERWNSSKIAGATRSWCRSRYRAQKQHAQQAQTNRILKQLDYSNNNLFEDMNNQIREYEKRVKKCELTLTVWYNICTCVHSFVSVLFHCIALPFQSKYQSASKRRKLSTRSIVFPLFTQQQFCDHSAN